MAPTEREGDNKDAAEIRKLIEASAAAVRRKDMDGRLPGKWIFVHEHHSIPAEN